MSDRLRELSKIWLDKAQDDLSWAKDSFVDGHFGSVCFVCQQVAEKALKSYLFSKKQTLVRTHHLPVLNTKCKEFDKDFSRLENAVNTLTNYYTDTRYPDIWDYSRFESKKLAEEAIKLAEQVLIFVTEKTENRKAKRGNILVAVLILAIVAGLCLAGFFVWKNKGVPPKEKVATSSATANWKTYTNPGLGVYFKYPGEYFVFLSPQGPNNSQTLSIVSANEKKCIDNPGSCKAMGTWLGILIINLETRTFNEDLLTMLKNDRKAENITSVQTEFLGNGYSYSPKTIGPPTYEITFYDKGRGKLVTFLSSSGPIKSTDKVFTILSTFKFL